MDALRLPLVENENNDVVNEVDSEVLDVNSSIGLRDKMRKAPCYEITTK